MYTILRVCRAHSCVRAVCVPRKARADTYTYRPSQRVQLKFNGSFLVCCESVQERAELLSRFKNRSSSPTSGLVRRMLIAQGLTAHGIIIILVFCVLNKNTHKHTHTSLEKPRAVSPVSNPDARRAPVPATLFRFRFLVMIGDERGYKPKQSRRVTKVVNFCVLSYAALDYMNGRRSTKQANGQR